MRNAEKDHYWLTLQEYKIDLENTWKILNEKKINIIEFVSNLCLGIKGLHTLINIGQNLVKIIEDCPGKEYSISVGKSIVNFIDYTRWNLEYCIKIAKQIFIWVAR